MSTTAPSTNSRVGGTLGPGIGEKFKDLIMNRRKGLKNMYGRTEDELNTSLEALIRRGEVMEKNLIEMGCTGEIAKELTVLTLYDVAILIGTFFRGSVHSPEFVLLTVGWTDG